MTAVQPNPRPSSDLLRRALADELTDAEWEGGQIHVRTELALDPVEEHGDTGSKARRLTR